MNVEGVIVTVRPNGTYEAALANGHRLVAFVAGRRRQTAPRLTLGEKVNLEVSPCDLSKGRIVVREKR